MKIGILGGAFDPIHNDHLATARAVLEAGLVDRVNIMPCFSHKFGKDMAPAEERYLMVVLACMELHEKTGLKVYPDDTEIKCRHAGSTYDLLTRVVLPNKRPEDSIHYIIGSDNALNIAKWHRYEDLLKIIDFVVVRRKGERPISSESKIFKGTGNTYFCTDYIGDCSSTKIREAVKSGRDISGLVPESVAEVIKKQKLYT